MPRIPWEPQTFKHRCLYLLELTATPLVVHLPTLLGLMKITSDNMVPDFVGNTEPTIRYIPA